MKQKRKSTQNVSGSKHEAKPKQKDIHSLNSSEIQGILGPISTQEIIATQPVLRQRIMNDKARCGKDYHIEENPRNPRYVVKQAINAWLASLAHFALADRCLHRLPWALLLETSKLHTLNALCEANTGITPSTTVVPNPDETHCKHMAARGVNSFRQTSHALLATLCGDGHDRHAQNKDTQKGSQQRCDLKQQCPTWPGVFDVVWLDYCGTFASIPGRHRRNDIYCLLRKNLLAAVAAAVPSGSTKTTKLRSLLAVTFSQRGVAPLYPHEVRLRCMGTRSDLVACVCVRVCV